MTRKIMLPAPFCTGSGFYTVLCGQFRNQGVFSPEHGKRYDPPELPRRRCGCVKNVCYPKYDIKLAGGKTRFST